MEDKDEKRITSIYGEMCLAMELHKLGWQVYRAYIDEHVDFIIASYYCTMCKSFSNPERRQKEKKVTETTNEFEKTSGTFPTDLCKTCKNSKLKFVLRFLQVKTSEGVVPRNAKQDSTTRQYSFHAKLRSNIDDRSFYAWIAIAEEKDRAIPHFYIFHHTDIDKFDNLSLPSYQKTDNQKLNLTIDSAGNVKNKGRKYDFSCFNNDFKGNFDKLSEIMEADGV